MTAVFQARVEHGRLVLDEPVNLPDGTLVDLVPADQGDALDDEDRQRLEAAIDRGIEEARSGQTVPAREVLARLRALRRP
jgi:hypothetical protein